MQITMTLEPLEYDPQAPCAHCGRRDPQGHWQRADGTHVCVSRALDGRCPTPSSLPDQRTHTSAGGLA